MAPFILSVHATDGKGAHFKDLLPEYNRRVPVIPQILGNDASGFVATARVLADFGYGEVNWNLGCPYPMVTGKRRGAGLLPHPDAIKAFLDETCARSALPVSVKLRLGLDDRREILAVMPVLNAFPLRRVIIHPRIGAQMYEGDVDLDGFAEAAALCAHEMMYNGDIRDAAGFEAYRKRFPGITGWMIGRGAVSNPFLPDLIKGSPLPADPVAVVRAFHDDIYFGYREILEGQKHVLDKMKELWTYLARSIDDEGEAVKAIIKAKTFAAYEAAVRECFSGARWRA